MEKGDVIVDTISETIGKAPKNYIHVYRKIWNEGETRYEESVRHKTV